MPPLIACFTAGAAAITASALYMYRPCAGNACDVVSAGAAGGEAGFSAGVSAFLVLLFLSLLPVGFAGAFICVGAAGAVGVAGSECVSKV